MAKASTESNDLAKGLAKAKTATTNKPAFFVLVLKGAEGVLLVDGKKIAANQIAEAKKRSGGTTLVNGVCYAEDGQIIFETPKPPAAAWAAAARKSAKDDANQTIKAVFRLGRDPDSVAESEEETESEEKTDGEVKPGAQPDAKAQWNARIAELKTRVLEYVRANGPYATDVKLQMSQALVLGNKGDFEKSNAALDRIETLLKGPETAPAGKNAAAERYMKLKGGISAALAKLTATNPAAAAVVQRVLDKAQGFADKRDFAQAVTLVEQAAKAATQALAASAGKAATPEIPTGKVAVEVLRVELRQVRMQAIKGVTELISKLKTSGAPQSQSIAEVIKKLAVAMPAELEGILQQFDAALKANDTAGVTRLRAEVQRAAKAWMDFLKANANSIAGCENNPWGVAVRIADPVRNSLKSILAVSR
jgi:hypothetical protein